MNLPLIFFNFHYPFPLWGCVYAWVGAKNTSISERRHTE